MSKVQKKEMKVIIDDNYWIVKQDRCFTLQKQSIREGKDGVDKPFIDDIGYFGDVGGALARYAKEATNDKFEGEDVSAIEYLKELENICQTIIAQVIKQ